MQPVLRRPLRRDFLMQYAKTVRQFIRIYTDKSDDIKLPPEPTTCCMSGCANCVWIEYAEELVRLFDGNDEKVREMVLNKISDPNLKMFLSVELKGIAERMKADQK